MRGGWSAGERSGAAGTGVRRFLSADFVAVALLLAIVTLLFADVLLGINSLFQRDVAYYFHPLKYVLREIVLGGDFPSWNPYFGGGQPMAANPQYEVFYPPTWLILLPSFDFGFALLIVLHLQLAAVAMYALLRSLALRAPAAFLGALSFALGGICLSYLNLLPCLFAAAWLPLTCLYTRRFIHHGMRRDFALAALTFGMQMLVGEPTTILQCGALLGIYALTRPARWRALARVALIAIAAAALGAVQLIPAADHAGQSVRGRGFAYEEVTSWSLPPSRIAELVHPNLFGHLMLGERRVYWGAAVYPGRGLPFLHSLYSGLLVTVLLLAGLVTRVRGYGTTLIAMMAAFLLAFGGHTPLWRWLYDSGLAQGIRYPEKFAMMGLFAALVFATIVLDRLLGGDARVRRAALGTAVAVAAITAAIALLALTPLHARAFIAAWEPPARVLEQMLPVSRSGWLLAAGRALLLLILLRNLERVRRAVWLALVGVFVLLDLALLLPELAPRVRSGYFTEPPRLARTLPPNRDDYRLFHLASWMLSSAGSYVAPQPDLEWIYRNAMYPPMPSRWGVRTVIDVDYDRTALTPTADFADAVRALSRARRDWLEVVASMSNAWYCAFFADEREAYARANEDRTILQPVRLLALAPSPRYFFAGEVEPIRDVRDFVAKVGSARFPRDTAFVAGLAGFRPAPGRVTGVRESANRARIEVETAGRAFLVISVTPQKYWRVLVDGREAAAVITNVGFQGVVVPTAGRHVVEMHYRNPLFAVGGVVSALAAAVLGACVILRPPHAPAREKSHRRPPRV